METKDEQKLNELMENSMKDDRQIAVRWLLLLMIKSITGAITGHPRIKSPICPLITKPQQQQQQIWPVWFNQARPLYTQAGKHQSPSAISDDKWSQWTDSGNSIERVQKACLVYSSQRKNLIDHLSKLEQWSYFYLPLFTGKPQLIASKIKSHFWIKN